MSEFPEDDFNEAELFSAPTQRPAQRQPHQRPTHTPAPRRTAMPSPFPPAFPEPFAAVENPLARYFRSPGLHIALPTAGAFLPPGAISLTQSNDIPVLPMRGADEMLLKSPDALMSGYALECLLMSCVPSITTPRLISMPDLDVLMLAIRAATYGDTMDLSITCPKCEKESTFECDLTNLLTTMKPVPPENPVRLSDELVAFVRPYNIENATRIALASFGETRKLQAIPEAAPQDVKSRMMNESIDRLARLTADTMSDCVIAVAVPGATVTNPAQISEFIANIPKPWSEMIDAELFKVNGGGIDKTVPVECPDCKHAWKTELDFDPSSFFAARSSESKPARS